MTIETDNYFYDALNEVLLTSRYDVLTGRSEDIYETISNWLSDLLYRLFSNVDIDIGATNFNPNVNPVSFATTIAIIILLATAIFVVYKIFINRKKSSTHDLSEIFEELRNKNYSVLDLIKLSDETLDRRIAVRYRYIAAILALNENGRIHIKESATNAIILKQIKTNAPELYQDFEYAANCFHSSWFGYKDMNDKDQVQFSSAINTIVTTYQREQGDI